MLRTLRMIALGIAGAAAGAVAGRVAADLRRQLDAGLQPALDPAAIEVRPRDVVPGLLAALRSGDRPWSYLRIPAWLVAFAVNFALAAFADELGPLRKAAGLDLFDGHDDSDAPAPETIEVDYVDATTSDPPAAEEPRPPAM